MATLKEIADKGYELKLAIDALKSLQDDKQAAQDRLAVANAAITAQAAVVDTLKDELKAMLP